MLAEKASEAALSEDFELRAAAVAELLAEAVVNEGLIWPYKRCRSKKKTTVKNTDGFECEVDLTAAMESARIKRCLLAGMLKDGVVAVSGFDGEVFDVAFRFCKNCVRNGPFVSWEDELLKDDEIAPDAIIDLISAANYLGIEKLKNITCRKVAAMMKGKSTDEIRRLFNVKDDLNISERNLIEKAKKAEK
ncbi:SKP1-like protein 11 [Typha latifolia]|uniref:SKP1-like protein 11 n=1 Tax=Typha latifolia TaxID=4733 RepID=UPI003C2BF119